jgi:predicted GNAT family acetyltransferase
MTGLGVVQRNYHCPFDNSALNVRGAIENDRAEVLAFLSQRPTHTFGMVGMILGNGIISPHNQGTFYICRNPYGQIEGVALLGYHNLFEAHSDGAIRAFAKLFPNLNNPYLLMGEEEKVEAFSASFNQYKSLQAESKRYLLYKQTWPLEVHEPVRNLRPATLDDLELVVEAHRQSGVEDTGVDGFQQDPLGFIHRCENRIRKKVTWVWVENKKLIFKVEILTSTPVITYLESLWINSTERNKGYGLRCLTQLGRWVLQNSSSICLLVNDRKASAFSLYEKAGYKEICAYRVLFFHQQ